MTLIRLKAKRPERISDMLVKEGLCFKNKEIEMLTYRRLIRVVLLRYRVNASNEAHQNIKLLYD